MVAFVCIYVVSRNVMEWNRNATAGVNVNLNVDVIQCSIVYGNNVMSCNVMCCGMQVYI